MKLSFDWLCDYVDLSGLTPQEVAEKLTMGAFEVEEVRKVGFDIQGPLVVGQIVEINPHPNADKIRLTKVIVEPGGTPIEIVCGAHNIAQGDIIPVALPGAKVLNRKDGSELPIKAGAIRGVTSNGMLCSPPELGLSADAEAGILILSEKKDARFHQIGADAKELLDLTVDWVLHVEPRSNRGDALSVIGLAREVAALLKRPLKQPDWSLPAVEAGEEVAVHIENTDDCPYFSVRTITNLELKPSPRQIQKRLEAVGVRCVNNVVDITNYVMHEYGQPLHAYDMRRVTGAALYARRARAGEQLTTLDGKARDLSGEVLVIADEKEVVGVAGVMGGKDSEISDDTTAIALEAACFHQARVRRGSRLLGLSSDSSLRFERGVDVAGVAKASDRAAYLIATHCTSGDKKARLGKFTTAGDDRVKPVSVGLRLKQIKRTMDVEFSADAVKDLLAPLGFKTQISDAQSVAVEIPSFRQHDVTREIDLVEEVCRLYGYDNLPVRMPRSTMAASPPSSLQEKARDAMSALGLSEAWASSLTGSEDTADEDNQSTVRVLNPLSADHEQLRLSLLPGLVKAASYNHDRGRKDIWLFEVGRTYKRAGQNNGSEKDSFNSGTGVIETQRVAAFVTGANELSDWLDQSQSDKASLRVRTSADFYSAKGLVENLLFKLGIDMRKVRFLRQEGAPAYMHPARCCQIALDKSTSAKLDLDKPAPPGRITAVGWLGELHPAQRDKFDFKEKGYLFELSLDSMAPFMRKQSFREIPSTPPVIRDLTTDVSEQIDHSAVHTCILAAAGQDLQELELVSLYQQQQGKKSLSFRLTFQNAEKTLTTKEVEDKLTLVRENLSKRLNAAFRD